MKKLMILAAVAAMSGVASANTCAPGSAAPAAYCATVYNVKFALKTPTADICRTAAASSLCGPGSAAAADFVRKPSTYALQGWFAKCACDCTAPADYVGNDIALWNTKDQLFMSNITYAVKENILHVLSKSQADAEILFNIQGQMNNLAGDSVIKPKFDLTGAGFGKFNVAQKRYTSFSGYVVGTVNEVRYPKSINLGTAANPDWRYCPLAGYWKCADVDQKCSGLKFDDKSIAYGTFAFNYNAAASTAMAGSATRAPVNPTIPAYVAKPANWN